MPPAPSPRRPVITGTTTVRRRPNWIVLLGDPDQILNVVPAAVTEGSRASRSYGGLLVRRELYDRFYRNTGAHRAPVDDAELKRPAPDSDTEDAAPARHDASMGELRECVADMKRLVQDMALRMGQLQPRSPIAGLGGLVTRGPSSAVVSVSMAPSSLRAPSPERAPSPPADRPPAPSAV